MNWIRESVNRSKTLKDHYKMHEIDIFIKDEITNGVNPDLVFTTLSKMIPSHLLSGVDIVYIGQFGIFKEKQATAVFQDGAIYVSNEQESDQDMIDDIVHELAHSVEERFTQFIYNENDLKNEFLGKRVRLYDIMNHYGYKPPESLRSAYHYDEGIDTYLYKKAGYEALWNLISGLFLSPYSVTSLREYFAVGFEYYFMGDKSQIKKTCPILYSKLENLEYMEKK